MYIDVENLHELKDRHPELDEIRNITANHGEKSEISVLCEVICKLYAKIDAIMHPPKEEVTKLKNISTRG